MPLTPSVRIRSAAVYRWGLRAFALAAALSPWFSGADLWSVMAGAVVGGWLTALTRAEVRVDQSNLRFRNMAGWREVPTSEIEGWVIGRDRLYVEARNLKKATHLAATVTVRFGQERRTGRLLALLDLIRAAYVPSSPGTE